VAVLGVGDPVAGFVGRRWGKHKLLHGRSLEGSAAFLVSAFAVALFVLGVFYAGSATLGVLAGIAIAAAIAGAVAEALSGKIDDNLSVPVAGACAAALVVAIFGG
jgi:dolichol kinase